MTGPLAGVRIVEMDAIGPVPLACMILSGLGADVVRVARAGGGAWAIWAGWSSIADGRRSRSI